MTPESVSEIVRQTLMQTFWLALPLLLIGFVAGAAISLIQAVTSIQDSAFGAVPRLAAFLGGLFVFLPWMLTRLMEYTIFLFGDLSRYAR
ncbi:MAG: flagellar biosynthetic protein FliQ [Acidobacteria bacterium]|nr:flagellar biosynthetic protein FliQ [Acidobacteriota bacterium]